MIEDYQDLETMETEAEAEDEAEMKARKAPPRLPPISPRWKQHACPTRRIVLVLLGISSIFAIAVVVFAAQGNTLRFELQGLQGTLRSINQTAAENFADIQSRDLEMQTKATGLEKTVTEFSHTAEAVKKQLFAKLGGVQKGLRITNCDVQNFKHNRTASQEVCCPRGWDRFRKSCYWESRAGKTWAEAKDDCEYRGAHLVIINNYEEQRFVAVRVQPHYTWIGLTDASGTWKWVDGTPYTVRAQDWRPEQPDDWYGHGLGGGEDCAHLHNDGLWNDDHCSRLYGWVCEMETTD